MSQVLSFRVPDQTIQRLDKFARRQGNGLTRTKAGMLLLEEALRETEFAGIEYRDSEVGRQPYMKGSGLAIWEVVMVGKNYDLNAERMADEYPYPVDSIKAAFNYYESFKDEIDQAIEDNYLSFDEMKRILPGIQEFRVTKEMMIAADKR